MEDLKLLKIMGKDSDDLTILSACLQDSLVPLKEIQYNKDQKQFVLLVNRYRWEEKEAPERGRRVHAALLFDCVTKAQFTGIDLTPLSSPDLSLLSLHYDAPHVFITFSQKASIRLEVENLKVKLRDSNLAWPAKTPVHPF
ncbi:MAG: hypothetical protein A2977_03490 [Alphaproteobacteria bacterium RIFCSPLOWO2_01_FULL_45_8]|nr:MAG: hypothetical protein A2065_03170 [Alphaproteobacteria bacterium GWB1_45_5]OFW76637.1 MAG: hypothetical protein A3K20_00445 [Alphaproteobacteria bacterium GWA1_45_9]OFW89722.1 MAG: hypothetical protein A2621_02335 [Alphaproteobacteria bacterium RIFCSPHIGHO2_01_FULL_41_14]OFW96099.1 MAG: hypothetical protein A2977_03490 [Alphaproteobacteria bacterium RIFCSPLOWO2_01_FULL_45_8]HCI49167.1 DUF2948 domain-containing protein [Holosporales bacterium]